MHAVTEASSEMIELNSKYPAHYHSQAVFRVFVNMHGISKANTNFTHEDNRDSSVEASIVHPSVNHLHLPEEDNGNTEKKYSQEPDKQMSDSLFRGQSKPVQQSQSLRLWNRPVPILLVFCCIFGIIVVFFIGSQFVHLETLTKCVNVKLHYPEMCNPPV
ncbi:hypothetical protein DNTS_007016 [Danionella cerebrum]|uniref:Uncharacterized protein n=1 Tax=Danionella cerebrum TaxID=2873325 RepID=A0A553QDJ1_9TELE|nr:hypothetical protein DNTS_007016 [Danionella translucida]